MRYLADGLSHYDQSRAQPGFTLFSPIHQKTTYLVNMKGEVVHKWDLPTQPGNYGYLLENGNLFIALWTDGGPEGLPAKGGLMQELDWDGNVVWEYQDDFQHHDFRQTESGNLIYLGWEILPDNIAKQIQGGRPGSEPEGGVWGDYIREVNREGQTVWEWHASENVPFDKYPLRLESGKDEYAHPNTIVPMGHDKIMVCYRHIDVIAIIDKKTGAYAWEHHEKEWGGPHDAQPLPNGNILFFANRCHTPGWRGSEIVEFNPKSREPVWHYRGNPTYTFDSHFISGCQPLDNGNVLICEGIWGRIFEVTREGDVVWEYISPFTNNEKAGPAIGDARFVFRAYRYAPDSPQIQGRLSGKVG